MSHYNLSTQTSKKLLSIIIEEAIVNQLNPKVLTKSGKKYVLLPYEEYLRIQELLEDLEALQDLRAAKAEERDKKSISLDELKLMF